MAKDKKSEPQESKVELPDDITEAVRNKLLALEQEVEDNESATDGMQGIDEDDSERLQFQKNAISLCGKPNEIPSIEDSEKTIQIFAGKMYNYTTQEEIIDQEATFSFIPLSLKKMRYFRAKDSSVCQSYDAKYPNMATFSTRCERCPKRYSKDSRCDVVGRVIGIPLTEGAGNVFTMRLRGRFSNLQKKIQMQISELAKKDQVVKKDASIKRNITEYAVTLGINHYMNSFNQKTYILEIIDIRHVDLDEDVLSTVNKLQIEILNEAANLTSRRKEYADNSDAAKRSSKGEGEPEPEKEEDKEEEVEETDGSTKPPF
jgi:hypothetical protein